MKLVGNWDKGVAFDLHTISSVYLGVDQFGYDQFDTTRSEMGSLVHQLKYKGDDSVVPKIVELLDTVKGLETFDYLIPIPQTQKRSHNPVRLITESLGEHRNVKVASDALSNSGGTELKGVTDEILRRELLEKAIKLNKPERFIQKNVLLVDDLFRSGSTLARATSLLLEKGQADRVCVLTMTKTRNKR